VTGESDLIQKCTIFDVHANKSGDGDVEPSSRFAVLVSGSTVNEGTA